MKSGWAIEYIGIPWSDRGRTRAGVDCYGLLWLVLSEQFGVSVPSYAENYATAIDKEEVGALMRGELLTPRWSKVADAEARAGDGIMISLSGLPYHVGVVVDPPYFLNVLRGTACALERWTSPRWNRRVEGFYRYAG